MEHNHVVKVVKSLRIFSSQTQMLFKKKKKKSRCYYSQFQLKHFGIDKFSSNSGQVLAEPCLAPLGLPRTAFHKLSFPQQL